MKKLIYISYLFSFLFVTISCEDMLDMDSSRYVTVDDNDLSSPNDSVYSVLGILRNMQEIAERYILLGEMRADLLDVTLFTPDRIRQLNDFSVEDTSEFADPKIYYDIINNCNYFISRTNDPDSPLAYENAMIRGIRAWVYMQVVFNWGKAYYYTEPILSVEDANKDYPEYDIKQMMDALIDDIEPYKDAPFTNYGLIYNFNSENLFIPIKVLLGDLYLWRGNSVSDYEKAAGYYADYIKYKNEDYSAESISNNYLYWVLENFTLQNFDKSSPWNNWSNSTIASEASVRELISLIQMATSGDKGKVSRIPGNWHYYGMSDVASSYWDDQSYVYHYELGASSINYYTTGDLRKYGNTYANMIYKPEGSSISLPMVVLFKIYHADHILLYRKTLIYLRYAEALNRAGKPHAAFAVLKYGLNPVTFADETKIPQSELEDAKSYLMMFNDKKYENLLGIHSRGCGHTAYDINYVLGGNEVLATMNDTILWVEDAICMEAALETSFEGNRFQDLMRIALRRNDPAYLAKRVAAKHEDNYDRIYQLLSDEKNWYLPEPIIK